MILAVTMNPSVDISYPIQDFKLDDVNRVENVRKTAGGKGLNVARVVKQMGEDVLATGVIGGTIGDYIIQELTKSDIRNHFYKINQESRNCIAILHEGKQTEILESGPSVSAEEGDAFLEKYRELLSEVSIVTISGSLPKGLESGFYRQMVEIGREKGIPVIIDTSGEPLRQVLNHNVKPFAIKPNISELFQLFGMEVEESTSSLKQLLNNKLFHGIEWIVVSMGAAGALLKHGGDYYRVTIPAIEVINAVGSGDATVAGLAVALKRKQAVSDILKTAMTTGMLNTMEEVTGYIDPEKFGQFFEMVEIIKID
ncbi:MULTISPECIES: tagatose-6-phosphate kinase [Bacillus cereus group]|uniref:Tagatose-6-phosphate kinase n=1 Tax=Bacillus cereus TaxID=1396 RepID=A0A2B8SZC7_BACCE|nr:tagatose-6-phosphate kinase [Bacillus cereus]PDY75188.1 tagatose-6-phosphate kinase [Bacillus cereus]PFA11743.1 tagatose-6-phosphate kinase [Bacillus cereus]PFM36294.1 tagatose-6-phosphate kinase [Bacillus cereus]PGL58463.1 tagatose-6-phosphate kinase [Bacillus cereus]PGQ04941.1 tagatose-6-phosphate kinase [Bacillus cereus]